MKKSSFILNKKDGEILNLKPLSNWLTLLPDGKHWLESSPINKRSNAQNNYYWLMLSDYIQPALYDQGWDHIKTKEDAHVFVADLFLKVKEVNKETGEMKERIKSTTELSKEDFSTYLEEIWRWSAEYLSISIPSPGEKLLINYE